MNIVISGWCYFNTVEIQPKGAVLGPRIVMPQPTDKLAPGLPPLNQ